ncbi:MAG: UDP-N-acetylglucosamine 1-carboxyvinyltransferase [Bdellovibrionales bacterium]|nr:UDP-N-acetylglucosamine 1-carboxyvinyltransferase [Bdellovibrionales bacterium]
MLIKGGQQLNGEVSVSGAKNSVLPLLFASLLADGEHEFENVPNLMDVQSALQLLNHLNCETQMASGRVKVHVKQPTALEAPYDIVRKMRASILCLGPLLSKYGEAKVSLPGGCAIGTRPIDLHLDAMRAMGAEIEVSQGYVLAKAKKLRGDRIIFDTTTVGGTENLLMAAALAEGETLIENAAKEPEIVDLADYLSKMGAKIEGAGSSVIRIQGVTSLKGTKHSVIPDRIEAGTLIIAGAITGGDVRVKNMQPEDIEALLLKLKECGVQISVEANSVRVQAPRQWQATDISTTPHPGFPTDLQAQFMSLMTVAQGTSVITENVFENRFMHVQELVRLDADITPKSRVAVVKGRPKGLKGAPVMATDLRASACLVLAGLAAQGETLVNRIYHLDRGYDGLEKKLSQLGAQVKRVK